jgi:hypothetical protein
MDPTTILIAALAVMGYFLFRDDKKTSRPGHDGRHGGRGHGGRVAAPSPGGGPTAPPAAPGRPAAGAGPLLDQMDTMINAALAQSDPDDAVSALKVAGEFGVTQIGPALDQQSRNRSKELTTAAAHDNAMLQAISTSKAGWQWATTVLFPFALALQIPAALATSATTSASDTDKIRATGLVKAMYSKYASALDQFAPGQAVAGYVQGGYRYGTGFGMMQPFYCFGAERDPRVCATVAAALATENDPVALRTLASHVAAGGYPQAANVLLAKADGIEA